MADRLGVDVGGAFTDLFLDIDLRHGDVVPLAECLAALGELVGAHAG